MMFQDYSTGAEEMENSFFDSAFAAVQPNYGEPALNRIHFENSPLDMENYVNAVHSEQPADGPLTFEQVLADQAVNDPFPSEQAEYDPVLKEQIAVDSVLGEQAAINPALSEQAAFDPVLDEQFAVDPVLDEQFAVDPVLDEQFAVDSVLDEQAAVDAELAKDNEFCAAMLAAIDEYNRQNPVAAQNPQPEMGSQLGQDNQQSSQAQPHPPPQPAVPQLVLPQPDVPQLVLPQPDVPQLVLPQPAVPQPVLPQPDVPQLALPQSDVPQMAFTQPALPQLALPQQFPPPYISAPQPALYQQFPPPPPPHLSVPQLTLSQPSPGSLQRPILRRRQRNQAQGNQQGPQAQVLSPPQLAMGMPAQAPSAPQLAGNNQQSIPWDMVLTMADRGEIQARARALLREWNMPLEADPHWGKIRKQSHSVTVSQSIIVAYTERFPAWDLSDEQKVLIGAGLLGVADARRANEQAQSRKAEKLFDLPSCQPKTPRRSARRS